MGTKKQREIKQIMPATGWYALLKLDGVACAHPLVAWAFVSTTDVTNGVRGNPYEEVVGMIALERPVVYCDLLAIGEVDTGFVGYMDEHDIQANKIKRIPDETD